MSLKDKENAICRSAAAYSPLGMKTAKRCCEAGGQRPTRVSADRIKPYQLTQMYDTQPVYVAKECPDKGQLPGCDRPRYQQTYTFVVANPTPVIPCKLKKN